MTAERRTAEQPGLQAALRELEGLFRNRFPAATFEVVAGLDDPEAVHPYTTVDADKTDDVMALVIDRLVELQSEEGLPIFVVPSRPAERALEELRRSPGRHLPAQM